MWSDFSFYFFFFIFIKDKLAFVVWFGLVKSWSFCHWRKTQKYIGIYIFYIYYIPPLKISRTNGEIYFSCVLCVFHHKSIWEFFWSNSLPSKYKTKDIQAAKFKMRNRVRRRVSERARKVENVGGKLEYSCCRNVETQLIILYQIKFIYFIISWYFLYFFLCFCYYIYLCL